MCGVIPWWAWCVTDGRPGPVGGSKRPERMPPTLPGVAEAATPQYDLVEEGGISSVPPSNREDRAQTVTRSASPSTSGSATARAEQSNAPLCYQCGMVMQRAGSCYL